MVPMLGIGTANAARRNLSNSTSLNAGLEGWLAFGAGAGIGAELDAWASLVGMDCSTAPESPASEEKFASGGTLGEGEGARSVACTGRNP